MGSGDGRRLDDRTKSRTNDRDTRAFTVLRTVIAGTVISPLSSPLGLLVAIAVLQALLFAFAFAVANAALVAVAFGLRFARSIGPDRGPSGPDRDVDPTAVEPSTAKPSREAHRPPVERRHDAVTYFARGFRDAGRRRGDAPRPDGSPGTCPDCGTRNDPTFAYCRSCTAEL